MSKLLTKTEVAELLRVSIRTVDRLRVSGQLPAAQVLGTVRFQAEDVQAFIENQIQRQEKQ